MVTMDFSAVAHDLRGPLNVMLGQMQMLSREPLSDRVRERLCVVEAQARRLVRLLESCNKEPSASRFARVDLTSVIGDAVAELDAVFARQGIEIAATTDPDLPGLLGDGDLLHRVLVNLLTNAADSIDGAGCIRIEAHVNRAGRERASIDIHISDTGGGIPADVVPRVFDYGFTTKTSTTPRGLGLSICREIIEMHGGRIALSSDRGRGTTVSVSLPAKA
jgi:two-component system sensor histidine kinase EvgS